MYNYAEKHYAEQRWEEKFSRIAWQFQHSGDDLKISRTGQLVPLTNPDMMRIEPEE
jgi:hypothetical protein